jgi:superfamily II DNA or RNA helicase
MKIILGSVKTRVLVGGTDILVDGNMMGNIRSYLSVKVPGSFHANKYLKYHWDGFHYFITPKGSMATGFLPLLLRFIEEEYPTLNVEIIDERGELPRFTSEFIPQIGALVINEQYIHQKHVIQAYNHWITFRGQQIYFPCGVADASTNAGKTAIIAGIFLNLIGDQSMLIIIHSKPVYRELLQYFTSVFGEIGQINDKNYFIKCVTLAMIQTLNRRIEDINVKKDIGQFTMLAVDEAHRAGAKQYTHSLVHCNAPVRVFVSGSAFDSSDIVAKMIIVGQSGPRLIKVAKKELMDKGISVPVKVKIHLCNTILRAPVLIRDECMEKLVYRSVERASIMLKIIKERISVGPILVAVERTKHGEFLLEFLTRFSQGLFDRCNIELTHGKDKGLIQKVDAFKNGEIDVLVVTGTLREGVNMPLTQTIIYAVGGESGIYIRQWMGRGERISESKAEFEFHDFYDIGKYVDYNSLHRLKIYKAENLSVEMDFEKKDLRKVKSIVIK